MKSLEKKIINYALILFGLIISLSLPAKTKEQIKFGVVLPLSGKVASYGQDSLKGIKLAQKIINNSDNFPYHIALEIEDNKGESAETIQATKKLIDIEKVVGFMGPNLSGTSLAMASIAQEKKIPMITPTGDNDRITKTGPYIRRACMSGPFQGKLMATFAYKDLNFNKIIVLEDNSSDQSKMISEHFQKTFNEFGGKIVQVLNYQSGNIDFKTVITKIKRKRPQAVFIPGYYTEAGIFLNQARKIGLKIPVLGTDGFDSPVLKELADQGADETYYTTHFSNMQQEKHILDFVSHYQKEYGVIPGTWQALGYDTFMLYAKAIQNLKNVNSQSLQDSLAKLHDFQGVTGSIKFDSEGNALKGAVIMKLNPKGLEFIKQVKETH